MNIVIFLFGLLLVSVRGRILRSSELEGPVSNERLSEVQAKFRSELNALIDSVLNSPSEIAQEMGKTIEECWSKMREELGPCKTCAVENCGEEFLDKYKPEMFFNQEKRGFWSVLSAANSITQAATGNSAVGWGVHYAQQYLGKRDNYMPSNTNQEKRLFWSALAATNSLTQAATGKSAVGWGIHYAQNWFGRRSLNSDMEQCFEQCPSCMNLKMPIGDLVSRVCGPTFFLKYAPVAEDVEILESLQEENTETTILMDLDVTSDKLEVEARFPSGIMRYFSKAKPGPEMAAMLAREYFVRFIGEQEQ